MNTATQWEKTEMVQTTTDTRIQQQYDHYDTNTETYRDNQWTTGMDTVRERESSAIAAINRMEEVG